MAGKKGLFYENILVLQPTNPLRSLKEIKKSLIFTRKKAGFISEHY